MKNIRKTYIIALIYRSRFIIPAHSESADEFEKAENKLPFRALWYQTEPIQAYFALGNYERVFYLTDKILNNHNKAFSELYLIRGEIYKIQGDMASAKRI